jgi:hypothetical protein
MRLSVKLNFSEDFEKRALNENTYMRSVDGSNIPNYFYRWTEREIKNYSILINQIKNKYYF